MGILKRILGICGTRPPAVSDCWAVADGKVTINLKRATELAKPGGAIRLEGNGLRKRILVFRGDDDRFHAFENVCSHAGHRRLDPVAGEAIIRCCSIGQSVFDYDGKRLSGSARESIEPLTVETEEETVVVLIGG